MLLCSLQKSLCKFSLLLWCVFLASNLYGEPLGSSYLTAPKNVEVKVGTHILALHNFNYSKKSFDIAFYSWWVTDIAGYEANKFVEVTNSYDFDIKNPVTEKLSNGTYRTLCRYSATVFHPWDMRDFPFDKQVLKVYMEDTLYEESQIKFVPDENNSRLSKDLILDGWNILDFKIEAHPYVYTTNFGNPLVPNSTYSRLTLIIELKRQGVRILFAQFIGFIIATFLSTLAFLVNPSNLSAKFSLSLGSVFAAMTNKYLIDSMLPISPNFTLSDAIQVSSFAFILLAVCSGVLETSLSQQNQIALGIKTSRVLLLVGLVIHVSFIAFFVVRAVNA